jgi:hypothetical protein
MYYRSVQLYSGPQVVVRIVPANKTYTLSKDLLCEQSLHFEAAFDGSFREGQSQVLSLTEMNGVISTQSFEMLIQWLYLGQICFGNLSGPKIGRQKITCIMEFLRMADMCGVTGMEAAMADQIRSIIMNTPLEFRSDPPNNGHMPHITPQHTRTALFLPSHHPVRHLVVNEAIEEYIRTDRRGFIMPREARGVQPSRPQVLRNAHLESFLAGLVE